MVGSRDLNFMMRALSGKIYNGRKLRPPLVTVVGIPPYFLNRYLRLMVRGNMLQPNPNCWKCKESASDIHMLLHCFISSANIGRF